MFRTNRPVARPGKVADQLSSRFLHEGPAGLGLGNGVATDTHEGRGGAAFLHAGGYYRSQTALREALVQIPLMQSDQPARV